MIFPKINQQEKILRYICVFRQEDLITDLCIVCCICCIHNFEPNRVTGPVTRIPIVSLGTVRENITIQL